MERDGIVNLMPVADSAAVLRLVKPTIDAQGSLQVSAIQLNHAFELSSQDKLGTPPHLSVWVEAFTSPQQAYTFLEANSPRKLILRLKTAQIRQIVAVADGQQYPNLLDVLFVLIAEQKPGAVGHAGITGLDDEAVKGYLAERGVVGLTSRQIKNLRKDLRAQLAELASQDCWLLPDV
jgi:hypothetical protein